MKIFNKLESYEKIRTLNLNKLPEKIFNQKNEKDIIDFLENNPAKYYAIRDKSKSGGIFKLKVEEENVLNEVTGYEKFSINVSSINYCDNQILVGEIQVLSNNDIFIIATTDKYSSVRDAYKKPEYNLHTNIYDKRLDDIPGFDYIYNYVFENNLIDVIVEFALYNIPVGIYDKNIVLFEIRTDY